jgi:hypothetical protein
MGKIELKNTLIYCIKIAFASLIMGALAWKISTFSEWEQSGVSTQKLVVFTTSFFASMATYLALTKLLRIGELDFLISMIRRKIT